MYFRVRTSAHPPGDCARKQLQLPCYISNSTLKAPNYVYWSTTDIRTQPPTLYSTRLSICLCRRQSLYIHVYIARYIVPRGRAQINIIPTLSTLRTWLITVNIYGCIYYTERTDTLTEQRNYQCLFLKNYYCP